MGFAWVRVNPLKSHLGPIRMGRAGYHGLNRSDPEWVFWCKTHATPMKNPLWVLSGHNGLTHLKPEWDPVGLAIWGAFRTNGRGSKILRALAGLTVPLPDKSGYVDDINISYVNVIKYKLWKILFILSCASHHI